MTIRVLFKCKGNICRSPAAEAYLQQQKPDWEVISMATTKNTQGQTIEPRMAKQLEAKGIPYNGQKTALYHEDGFYDRLFLFVYDLHELGLEDPYITGRFEESLEEIINFVDKEVLCR